MLLYLSVVAQNISYPPYSEVKGKVVVSNFYTIDKLSGDDIFLKALLWTIKNGQKLEGQEIEVDYDKKQFALELYLTNQQTGTRYRYLFSAKVTDNIITCLASNIVYEAEAAVIKLVKKLPFERLQPEKKPKHKEYLDDFANLNKKWMQQVIDFVNNNQPVVVTHWSEIKNKEVVKGMNEAECFLSLGKPASIQKTDNKVEWMYDSYTYLFFENGVLVSIIR